MEPKRRRNTMLLDQINSPAHTCIRKPQIVAAAQSGGLSFLNIQHSMISPFSESLSQAVGASIRIGLTADDIKQAFRDNLVCGMGRLEAVATKHDLYFALALTVRDRLFHQSVASIETTAQRARDAWRISLRSSCSGRILRIICSTSASRKPRAKR
jgi:hypothetical protein